MWSWPRWSWPPRLSRLRCRRSLGRDNGLGRRRLGCRCVFLLTSPAAGCHEHQGRDQCQGEGRAWLATHSWLLLVRRAYRSRTLTREPYARDHPSAGTISSPISRTISRSAWSRCWRKTRSTPASAYARSRATTSSTVPTSLFSCPSSTIGSSSRPLSSSRRRDPLEHLPRVAADDAAPSSARTGSARGPAARTPRRPALAARGTPRRREGGVVLVGPPRGEPRTARARGAAEDQRGMRLLQRLRLGPAALEPVVAPLERELLLRPLPVDDLELLLEVSIRSRQVGEREAEAPRARARSSPRRARARRARRRCGRPSQPPSRAPTGGGTSPARPSSRAGCARSPQPARRASPRRRAPRARDAEDRLVVVGAEQPSIPSSSHGTGERQPLLPGDALLALDHQRDPHRVSSETDSTCGVCGNMSTGRTGRACSPTRRRGPSRSRRASSGCRRRRRSSAPRAGRAAGAPSA